MTLVCLGEVNLPCMEEYCELFVSWAKIKLNYGIKKNYQQLCL